MTTNEKGPAEAVTSPSHRPTDPQEGNPMNETSIDRRLPSVDQADVKQLFRKAVA
jgi:hypothetical protein